MTDCIQDWEQAKSDRFWDSVALWEHSRFDGGVYVLGYAAEMTLKCAYFRARGFSILQPIGRQELRTAVAAAPSMGVFTQPESYHSVLFWSDLLIAFRATMQISLNSATEAMLRNAASTIYREWHVEMRYRRSSKRQIELEQVAAAADWIDKNYITLYT